MLSSYRIPNQLPDEQVVRIIRKDLFIMFKRIVGFALMLGTLIAFFIILFTLYPTINESQFYPAIILGASGYMLYIWLFFFFMFIDYYLDVWIITNERIINIEQEGFFFRMISEERLFRIQDVTSEVKGVVPTMFGYGDVYIQTAGEKSRFNFEQVPNPDGIRDIIIRLAEVDRSKQTGETKQEIVGTV
jgi:uncharacterized membrane protein YdbT with pleckstrin-like domain